MYEVDKIVKQTSALLSELTNLTCIVQTPSVRKSYIKSIQLLKIDNHNLVLVVVTQSGLIKNNRIRVVEMPEQSEFQRINEVLEIRLKNLQ